MVDPVAMAHMSGSHLGGSIHPEGDPNTWMPDVWQHLIEKYDVLSMLDIGCGTGVNTAWFEKHCARVIGIDGTPEYVEQSKLRRESRVVHDYTKGPYDPGFISDLAWSSEFVEHVEEQFIPNFMATFQRCRYVCITHATPGQGGINHMNEQSSEYWIAQFAYYGFRYDAEETAALRATDSGQPYGRRTLLFFVNEAKP